MGGSFFPPSGTPPPFPKLVWLHCLIPVTVLCLGWVGPTVTFTLPHGRACLQEPQRRGSAPLACVQPGGAVHAAEHAACSGPSPEGPQAAVLDEDPTPEDTGANGGQGEAHRTVTACIWGEGGGGVGLSVGGGLLDVPTHTQGGASSFFPSFT